METQEVEKTSQTPVIEVSDNESNHFDPAEDYGLDISNNTIEELIDYAFATEQVDGIELDSEHVPSHAIEDGIRYFPGETKTKKLADELRPKKHEFISVKAVIQVSQDKRETIWLPLDVLKAWRFVGHVQNVQKEYKEIRSNFLAAKPKLVKKEQAQADELLQRYENIKWRSKFDVIHGGGLELYHLRRLLGTEWLNDDCITALQHVLISRLNAADQAIAEKNAIFPFMLMQSLLNEFEKTENPTEELNTRRGDIVKSLVSLLSGDHQVKVYLFGHISNSHWAAFTIDNTTKTVYHGP